MPISVCCSLRVLREPELNWREDALIHYGKSFVSLDQFRICDSSAGGKREPAGERCKTLGSAGNFGSGNFLGAAAVDRHCIFVFAARNQTRPRGISQKYFAGRYFSLVGNYSAHAAKQSGRKAGQPGHCFVCSRSGMDKFCVDEIAEGKLKALIKIPHNPFGPAARFRGIFRFHRDVKNRFDAAGQIFAGLQGNTRANVFSRAHGGRETHPV
jgi:hypothetical protein